MIEYAVPDETFRMIMPQKHPMLLIDGIVECSPENKTGICGLTVGLRNTAALDENGCLSSFCMIEIMAQTMAAVSSYSSYCTSRQKMQKGLLMTIRDCRILCGSPIRPKTEILIRSVPVYNEADIIRSSLRAWILSSDEVISEALITACQTVAETG